MSSKPSPKRRTPQKLKGAPTRARAKKGSKGEGADSARNIAELETEELWVLYKRTAKAEQQTEALQELRNELIERHIPLVKYIAERLLQTLPRSIQIDDLKSAGLFGLMDAIRGFDPPVVSSSRPTARRASAARSSTSCARRTGSRAWFD